MQNNQDNLDALVENFEMDSQDSSVLNFRENTCKHGGDLSIGRNLSYYFWASAVPVHGVS